MCEPKPPPTRPPHTWYMPTSSGSCVSVSISNLTSGLASCAGGAERGAAGGRGWKGSSGLLSRCGRQQGRRGPEGQGGELGGAVRGSSSRGTVRHLQGAAVGTLLAQDLGQLVHGAQVGLQQREGAHMRVCTCVCDLLSVGWLVGCLIGWSRAG